MELGESLGKEVLIKVQKGSLKVGLQNVLPPSGKILHYVMVASYLTDQQHVLAPAALATPVKCEGKFILLLPSADELHSGLAHLSVSL